MGSLHLHVVEAEVFGGKLVRVGAYHGRVSTEIVSGADERDAAGEGAASNGVVGRVDFFSLRVFAAHATGGQVSFLLKRWGSGPCWGVCVSWRVITVLPRRINLVIRLFLICALYACLAHVTLSELAQSRAQTIFRTWTQSVLCFLLLRR